MPRSFLDLPVPCPRWRLFLAPYDSTRTLDGSEIEIESGRHHDSRKRWWRPDRTRRQLAQGPSTKDRCSLLESVLKHSTAGWFYSHFSSILFLWNARLVLCTFTLLHSFALSPMCQTSIFLIMTFPYGTLLNISNGKVVQIVSWSLRFVFVFLD